MNKIKLLIVVLLVLIYGIPNVNASAKYRYVCDNQLCYNTKFDFRSDYYLGNTHIKNINNFSDTIDKKIQDYIDYYDPNEVFTIKGFCDNDTDCSVNSNVIDKDFTLSEIINYGTGFGLYETNWPFDPTLLESYDNGYDYLFTNFTDIIDELHSKGYPGIAKDNLSDMVGNIVSYSGTTNEFNFKNICIITNSKCNESVEDHFAYGDNRDYKFVYGIVKPDTAFVGDTFKVSNDYSITEKDNPSSTAVLIKAGGGIDYNFGFEDYLDFGEDSTQYEYRIYLNDNGDGIPDIGDTYIDETITIDNNSCNDSTCTVTSATIGDQVNDIIDVTVIDKDSKQIRVGVKEGITLTEIGSKDFYLQATNITSNQSFPVTLINSISLEVLPNDDVKSGLGLITSPFTPTLNESGFGMNIPFGVEFNLKDEFGNNNFDQINGYDISLSAGSSSKIQLSTDSDVNTAVRSTSLNGVKTNSENKVKFYFRITEPGNHVLNGFNFKVREKLDSNNYITPANYYTLNGVIPSNLYDGTQKMKIYIETPLYSVLPINCGNPVKINFICESDNYSECHTASDTHQTYYSEGDNGTNITIQARDNAFNWISYNGTLNHVDTTAPVTTIFRGGNQLLSSNYDYYANGDDLTLKFYEKTTSNCNAEVNYEVKVNGNTYQNGKKIGINTELNIPNFFKTSGTYNLVVKVTDKYGNSSTKSIDFNIVPNTISELNSTISLIGTHGNKFANNNDYYTYKMKLKDDFGNNVYNKEILSLDTKCNGNSSCKEIKTKFNSSGIDAINEFDDNGFTDSNGEFTFKIKSLAPADFTEMFYVKLKSWDNGYTNTHINKYFYIGSLADINNFKKPIGGIIKIIEGGDTPKIGRKQKYEIDLSKIDNNNINFSLGNLDINKVTMKTLDGHFWQEFNLINKNFGSDISTPLTFSGNIDAYDNVLEAPKITAFNLPISYKLDTHTIKYYLDNFNVSGCSTETLGLKIIGTLQGNGKSNITGQDTNFSDLTKSSLRNTIRRNAYLLIKNMSSNTILDGVKYVEGDIDISNDQDALGKLGYETLIVKNGNVIISSDLNVDNNKLGIIVLKDNYVTKSDYNKQGNIYINKNVENINANIYADGTLRSALSNGDSYNDLELNKLLKFTGTLFTRNTIGGALKGATDYTLPGGQVTTFFKLAQIYDLNYVRKSSDSCNSNDYSFIIKYNPSIQLDPPKGFSSN